MEQLAEAMDSRDPAIGLAAVAALRSLVDELEALHVDNARRQGWTWQAIADALGITQTPAATSPTLDLDLVQSAAAAADQLQTSRGSAARTHPSSHSPR